MHLTCMRYEEMARRYLVGEVGGNPGWGRGILACWGCKHHDSAIKLFNRLVAQSDVEYVFIYDRSTDELIARREKSTPEQDREFIILFIKR